MQIGVCMFRDEVPEKVVVGFAGNENVPMVEVEQRDEWWGPGIDVCCAPSEHICPFVPGEPHVCTYVCEVRGAPPDVKSVGFFPKKSRVCVRVVDTGAALDGSYLLESRGAV